jgi:hypothetical protein
MYDSQKEFYVAAARTSALSPFNADARVTSLAAQVVASQITIQDAIERELWREEIETPEQIRLNLFP